ncbi:MAG: alpha/beta hydrolase fold domain-containing protein [Deltaproteobacteria bacterium]|nr:alpha/beta hydrolase fold domain-containing protein [Deltaproteobacteria bacterium]
MLIVVGTIFGAGVVPAFAAPPGGAVLNSPGSVLSKENFARPLKLATGDTSHFASGYKGWRFNIEERAGAWRQEDGVFSGAENASHNHPATASYGFEYTDAIVEFDVRINDVPWEGRKWRYFNLRTTADRGYVTTLSLNLENWGLQKDDNDRDGPDEAASFGRLNRAMALGTWTHVMVEWRGDEFAATIDGRTIVGRHPQLARVKQSIMFVTGCESSVGNLVIRQGRPNPKWPAIKAALKTDDILSEPETLVLATAKPGDGKEEIEDHSKDGVRDRLVKSVVEPSLTVYLPAGNATGQAVLIAPGGGYGLLAIDKEGHHVARWLQQKGIAGIVLKYRLPGFAGALKITASNTLEGATSTVRVSVEDARAAIRTIREHASVWHLDPKKIGMMGFSAGGHLTAMMGVLEPDATRPAFLALIYPALGKIPSLPATTPPTFIAHADDDRLTPMDNSIPFYVALKKAGGKAELHVYATGGHGFGIRRTGATSQGWPAAFEKWIATQN